MKTPHWQFRVVHVRCDGYLWCKHEIQNEDLGGIFNDCISVLLIFSPKPASLLPPEKENLCEHCGESSQMFFIPLISWTLRRWKKHYVTERLLGQQCKMYQLNPEFGLTGNYINLITIVKLHILSEFPSVEKPACSVSMRK